MPIFVLIFYHKIKNQILGGAMLQIILLICSVFSSLENAKSIDIKNDELALNTIQTQLEKSFTSEEKKEFALTYGFMED